MKYLLILLFIYLNVTFLNGFVEKARYPRIQLIRQKPPRKHLIEHREQLERAGYNLDFLDDPKPPRTNDSINLYRFLDNEFYGQIQIGHPRKVMNVAFDTAWAHTWVISSRCQPYLVHGCAGHNTYDHDKSSFYKKNGTSFNEGVYSGFYSYDNITLAHSNVTGFLFVEMTKVPDSLALQKADGVMGLGIRVDEYEPFLYALHRLKKIENMKFSIFLNRDRQSKRGGNIMLGFIDEGHIHKTELKNKTIVPDTITYLKVDPGQFWQFSVDRINIVHSKINTTKLCQTGCKGVADSSSAQIIGPNNDIAIIHDIIKAVWFNGSWTVDCDTINKLPKIDFVLGGTPFRLSGKQYVLRESYKTHTYCISAFTPSNDTVGQSTWVLGGAFLAQYYSIYDIAERTIGFVRAA